MQLSSQKSMGGRHRQKYRERQKERSVWKWYIVSLQNGSVKNLAIVPAKYKKSYLLLCSVVIGVIYIRYWRQTYKRCSIPAFAAPFHICFFGGVAQNFKSRKDINHLLSLQNIQVFFFTSFPLIPEIHFQCLYNEQFT